MNLSKLWSILLVLTLAAVAKAQSAPVFNVKTYGAKGDGATNDTVNIQRAIDAADAVNVPVVVYFPRGVYMLTQALLSSTCADITITGDGATLKRISGLTDGQATIKLLNCDRCIIERLVLDGNQLQGSGTNSLILISGTSSGAAEDNRVRHCLLKNTWNGAITGSSGSQVGNGLTMSGSYVWRTVVEDVDVTRVGGDGVRFTCNDTRLIDVHIRDYRNRGFRGYPGGTDDIYPGRRVWIDQCSSVGSLDVRNGGSALLIDPGRDGINEVYVTNSRFELNRTTMYSNTLGVSSTGTHAAGNAAKFAHIENLHCDNCEFKVPYNYYLEAKAVRLEDSIRRSTFTKCRFKPNVFFTETGHGGITAHRPYFENETTGTCQAGSAAGTIVLASGASSSNDVYNGLWVYTTGGTGSGQSREITDYVGSSRTATVISNWSVTPDGTTTYAVGGGDYATCPAAGTTTTVRLAYATASLIDDYYNGRTITLNSGTGAGQTYQISDYDYTDTTGNGRTSDDTFTVTINGSFVTPADTSTTYAIKPSGKVQFTIAGDKTVIPSLNDDETSVSSADIQEMYVYDTGIARYNVTHVAEDVTSTTDNLAGTSPRYTQTIYTNVPFLEGTLDTDDSSDGTKGSWRTVPDETYFYDCEFGDRTFAEICYGCDAFSGTALGGSANTIVLPGGPKSSTTYSVSTGAYNFIPNLRYDQRSSVFQNYLGRTVSIDSGTGSGQSKAITNYDLTTGVCTVVSNWTTPPDNTSVFSIAAGGSITGTAQGGSNTTDSEGRAVGTITLASTASAVDDAYNGRHINFDLDGSGGTTTDAVDIRTITDYNGTTKVATVQAGWTSVPTSSSTYSIIVPTSNWQLAIENADSRIFEVEGCKFYMYGVNTAIEYAVDSDAYMQRLRLVNNECEWSDTGSQYLIAPENLSAVLKRSGKVIVHGNRLRNNYTGTANLVKTTNSIDSGVTGVGSSATAVVLDGSAGGNIYAGKTLTIGSESRLITAWDNATFTATVSPGFSVAPSSSVSYAIADVTYADRTILFAAEGEQPNRFSSATIPSSASEFPVTGLANAGGTATIFLRNDASGVADYYNGCPITLTGGTGSGGIRTITDYEVLTETGTCQAGSAAATIVLASGASAVDDFYNGYSIETTFGTGANQRNVVIDYVGSTRTCTVTAWGGATPDNTTRYRLAALRATVNSNWTTPPDNTSTYSIAADPTEGMISWSVGDIVRNSSPNNAAKQAGWIYSNAGWQSYGDKPWFSGVAADTWIDREAHNQTYRVTAADKVIQLPKLSSANLGGTTITFVLDASALSTGVGLRIRPHQDTTVGGTSVGEYIVLASVSNSKSDSLCLAGAGDREGDMVTLRAGLDSWYIVNSVGTWTKYDEIEP